MITSQRRFTRPETSSVSGQCSTALPKKDAKIAFASTGKNLLDLCGEIHPFLPGHYYDGEKIVAYHEPDLTPKMSTDDFETATHKIHDLLVESVDQHLASDAPVGYLLSGCLDSS